MADDLKAPKGYSVLTADDHFVGIWRDRETAEKVVNRSPSAKGERIVEYVPVTALRAKDAEIARLAAENKWFRGAQGVRDAEDQRALDSLKERAERAEQEIARLAGLLDAIALRSVPMTAQDEYRRGYKDALDAVRAHISRDRADIDAELPNKESK